MSRFTEIAAFAERSDIAEPAGAATSGIHVDGPRAYVTTSAG